jgi:hypothetical protein
MTQATKKCNVCGQEKPISAFYIWNRKTKTQGIRQTVQQPCRKCLNIKRREIYNKEKYTRKQDLRHKYSFIRAGVSYKEVIPPEKWPRMEHFLASFCRYALLAEKAGRKLNVDLFLSEYRKIYARKDVAMI